MAEFEPAFSATIWNEGEYASDPVDRGGETYKGISRRWHPRWPGWVLIDQAWAAEPDQTIEHLNATLAANRTLQAAVSHFFHLEFWRYDGMSSQEVANKVFDMAVNMGSAQAHRYLQHIVEVIQDGKYGPKTQAAVNGVDAERLLYELRVASAEHYVRLVLRDPTQERFLRGWLRRACR